MKPTEPGVMRTELGSSSRAMARGAGINLVGALAANILAFLFNFVITHVVRQGAFGKFSLGLTVVALAQIPAQLGLETGVTRFVALGAAKDDERAARGALQIALVIVAAASLAAAVVLWFGAAVMAGFFHKPSVAPMIRLVSVSLPFLAVGRIAAAGAQGFGNMRYAAWLGSARILINLLAAVPLLILGYGATGLAIAWDVAALAFAVASVAVLRRIHASAFVLARDEWHPRRMLAFSTPKSLAGVMFLAIVSTDTIILGRYRSASIVAIYAIAGRILTPAMFVSTAVGQMFNPRIVAAEAHRDRLGLGKLLKRVTYWNTAISLPLFVIFAMIPGPLLGLFGRDYTDGAAALGILAVGQLLNTATGPLGQVINMSGRAYLTLVNNSIVAVSNVALCLILIPRYGLVGAAICTSFALLVNNAICMAQVRWLFGAHPFRADTVRTMAATALVIVATLPLVLYVHWPLGVLECAAVSSAILVLYSALVYTVGMSAEDRTLVRSGASGLARRLGLRAVSARVTPG